MPQPALSQVSVFSTRIRWLLKQAGSLLPVPYAHVVFTVPEQLAPLALRNQKALLHPAVSGSVRNAAQDRCRSTPSRRAHRCACRAAHLVAELETPSTPALPRSHRRTGFLITPAGSQPDVISGFFLPVRVLSRMFRGKLLAFLKQSYRRSERYVFPGLSWLNSSTPTRISHAPWWSAPNRVGGLLQASVRRTRTCPEVPGPLHAILPGWRSPTLEGSLSLENGRVRFRWRDSRHNNRSSVMELDAVEFIRRFLLHVLPAGFVKIPATSDCLPTATAVRRLPSARLHLCTTAVDPGSLLTEQQMSALSRSCPQCKYGTMHVVARSFAVELLSSAAFRLFLRKLCGLLLQPVFSPRTASRPAIAPLCPDLAPHSSRQTSKLRVTPTADTQTNSATARCGSPRLQSAGLRSPQAASNLHTSTALAAYCKSPYPQRSVPASPTTNSSSRSAVDTALEIYHSPRRSWRIVWQRPLAQQGGETPRRFQRQSAFLLPLMPAP